MDARLSIVIQQIVPETKLANIYADLHTSCLSNKIVIKLKQVWHDQDFSLLEGQAPKVSHVYEMDIISFQYIFNSKNS